MVSKWVRLVLWWGCCDNDGGGDYGDDRDREEDEVRSLRRGCIQTADDYEAPDEAGGEVDVEVDCFEQFFLGDFFVGGVGDVDGAGAEQEAARPRR